MTQINTFFEEEPSNFDILGDFCSKINSNINQEFHLNGENEKINDIIYKNNFENQFNKVFNQSNIPLSTNGKELQPYIIKKKIFKPIKPNRKENIAINYKEKNEKYFPFTPGIGLENCLKELGYSIAYISPFEVKLSSLNKESIKLTKFQIMDFSRAQKGKLKKEKKKRKYKADDLRKKIKTRFHKALKNIINTNLKKVGSKKLFDFFPQYFVKNITIKLNNTILNYTFEELIKTDIATDILKQKKISTDLEKYNRNIDVLDYLNNNPKICKDSLFHKIKNMKYIDILSAYFLSKEFEDSIIEMIKKGEKDEYIEEYINKSLSYVYFYKNSLSKQSIRCDEFSNITNEHIFGNSFDNGEDYENFT